MSRSGGFCPRCGSERSPSDGYRTSDATAASEARLCLSCFRDDLDLVTVPTELTIRFCVSCGAVVEDGKWVDTADADYTDIAIERVTEQLAVHREARDVQWTVQPMQRGPNELELQLSVTAMVGGEPVTEEPSVMIRLGRETCNRCGKIAGDSYAGTVQIRATGRQPSEDETDRAVEIAHQVVDEQKATGDRDAFITEVMERPEGLDVRVSTNKIGGKIASRITAELGGHYETSETLVTEDGDGRGVYRVAFAIRLPQIRPGDIIETSDGPLLIERGRDHLRGRNLATGEAVTVDPTALEDDVVIGSVDDLHETTVVAVVDEQSVQVLDPITYETRTIRKPADFPADADTISVFKHGAAVYAVPGVEASE